MKLFEAELPEGEERPIVGIEVLPNEVNFLRRVLASAIGLAGGGSGNVNRQRSPDKRINALMQTISVTARALDIRQLDKGKRREPAYFFGPGVGYLIEALATVSFENSHLRQPATVRRPDELPREPVAPADINGYRILGAVMLEQQFVPDQNSAPPS